MGWWLLISGILIVTVGLFGKIKEYRKLREYIDFQNMTTNKRYLKEEDIKKKKDKGKGKQVIRKDGKNERQKEQNDENIKNMIDKRDELNRINEELNQIIGQITRKESMIKKIIKNSDIKKENLLNNNKEKVLDDKTEERKADFKKVLDQSSTTKKEDVAFEEEITSRDEKIMDYHQQGFSIEEIAEKLNLGIRETQLILRLHQREADKDA